MQGKVERLGLFNNFLFEGTDTSKNEIVAVNLPAKISFMRRLFSTGVTDGAFSFAMLLMRVGIGSLMLMQHGLDKLMHFSRIAPHFADPFGIGSTTSLAMVLFAEVFCATFVILGLFTRLACIPLVIAMAVALFYASHGQFFGKGELPGLYLVCFLVILFNGPGSVSLDRFIAK